MCNTPESRQYARGLIEQETIAMQKAINDESTFSDIADRLGDPNAYSRLKDASYKRILGLETLERLLDRIEQDATKED